MGDRLVGMLGDLDVETTIVPSLHAVKLVRVQRWLPLILHVPPAHVEGVQFPIHTWYKRQSRRRHAEPTLLVLLHVSLRVRTDFV